MTSEIKHSHLNPAQVYELNERHGYFKHADAQGNVSAAFANEAVAEYLRVNEEAQAVMAEYGLSPRELLDGFREMRNRIEQWLAANEATAYGEALHDARAALAKHKEV